MSATTFALRHRPPPPLDLPDGGEEDIESQVMSERTRKAAELAARRAQLARLESGAERVTAHTFSFATGGEDAALQRQRSPKRPLPTTPAPWAEERTGLGGERERKRSLIGARRRGSGSLAGACATIVDTPRPEVKKAVRPSLYDFQSSMERVRAEADLIVAQARGASQEAAALLKRCDAAGRSAAVAQIGLCRQRDQIDRGARACRRISEKLSPGGERDAAPAEARKDDELRARTSTAEALDQAELEEKALQLLSKLAKRPRSLRVLVRVDQFARKLLNSRGRSRRSSAKAP